MHTNDKNAPKMGTLLYRVDNLDKPSTEVSQYVVVYDGTEVCLIMLNSPSFKIKYEPDKYAPTIRYAYLQAAELCRNQSRKFEINASLFDKKAEEIE